MALVRWVVGMQGLKFSTITDIQLFLTSTKVSPIKVQLKCYISVS